MEGNILSAPARKVRRQHLDLELAPWRGERNGWRVDREHVALIDDRGGVTEFLGAAVVVEKSVVFPFHVVEFGVDVGRKLRVTPQLIGEKFETPTHVPIAVE